MELQDLSYYADRFGYIGIFIYFISLDQFTPIPNELSLISIGYLCSRGILNPVTAGLVCYSAFITIDLIYFFFSRTGNVWLNRMIHRKERPFLDRLTENLHDNFSRWIIILCFVPRMRFWSPVVSGLINVPTVKFIKYDAIGLFIFTLIYFSIGLFIHSGLTSFVSDQNLFVNILIIAMACLAILLLVLFYKKK